MTPMLIEKLSRRRGPIIPPRPGAGDPPFHQKPLAATYVRRRDLYLDWAAAEPTPGDLSAIWAEICKLSRGQEQIDPVVLEEARVFISLRRDCSDFILTGLVRALFLFAKALPQEQVKVITELVLGFQYWLDEPNPQLGAMELWTENHQILVHTSEYLAGQLFPQEVFSNTRQRGHQKLAVARERILKWLDWRVRTGFAEWDSIPYYPEDLAALLNLADFAQDKELAKRATMLVDLIIFDVAVDSFYGQYGSSHGRAYDEHIKSAAGDTMLTSQAILWGLGRFQANNNMGSVSLATSSYRLPLALEEIGQANPQELTNLERHSVPVTRAEAAKRRLSFKDDQDISTWWAMGAFTHPLVIAKTIELAERWNFWHYSDFRPFKVLGQSLGRLGLLGAASRFIDPDPNGVLMSEVNKVTFRTPDYMLSNAQDWRKGEKGYQQHIWQATLGPYAVVFVTNPDSLEGDDINRHRPSYWASHGRLPRTAQHRNVLVAIHKVSRRKGILEARHYPFTHAYFPRWAFDELAEAPAPGGGRWYFGRRGQGYLALFSRNPCFWIQEGPDADQDLVAPGGKNVWICQLGRRQVDGSFKDFIEAISSAELRVIGLQVEYAAPGLGQIQFGWRGSLTIQGREVPLRNYPRWHNPWCTAPFDSTSFSIGQGANQLYLDFCSLRRTTGGTEE